MVPKPDVYVATLWIAITSHPDMRWRSDLTGNHIWAWTIDIQSKILRVLTDQKFKRLNGNKDINVDVRLICSSNKDLKEDYYFTI